MGGAAVSPARYRDLVAPLTARTKAGEEPEDPESEGGPALSRDHEGGPAGHQEAPR